jgi:hypothetical protein
MEGHLTVGSPSGGPGLTAGAFWLSTLLASASPLALLDWDGQFDTSAFWDSIDWNDYRGADAD